LTAKFLNGYYMQNHKINVNYDVMVYVSIKKIKIKIN